MAHWLDEEPKGKRMTRREMIDFAVVGASSEFMLPLRRAHYELYREVYASSLPPFEEALFAQRPYLASDELFATWFDKLTARERLAWLLVFPADEIRRRLEALARGEAVEMLTDADVGDPDE